MIKCNIDTHSDVIAIFQKRFKECYKEMGYTQESLAEALDIPVDTIKTYTRKKADRLPPLDLIKKISDKLDIDSAYLLGEIDCKKYSYQTICDITGLSEDAAEKICNINNNVIPTLNELILHPNFQELLFDIDTYTKRPTMRVLSKNIDTAHPNDEFVSILEEHHEIKKFNVFKTIDSIIIDIYKKNKKPTHN